jgi:chemotaxis protein histidine kinase CheA/CheY-like chemotaxis protein
MHQSAIDAAEAELQQELREMFTVDTQQQLETYFNTIDQVNPQTWVADIQQLYRVIHTIKGGAVTVAADAMLQVAMVLEDLLSDLRYLEVVPTLTDGVLGQILLEAGELLSSSIEVIGTGAEAIAHIQPTVQRLIALRDRVKQLYLPDWNELKQVHQEFAEQGFDLVILDLEIALSKIPDRGLVTTETIEAAQATITQLSQIGIDLELHEDWTILLQDCEELLSKPDCQLWTSVWFEYFQLLKTCVKNSGKITTVEIERLDTLTIFVRSINFDPLNFIPNIHEEDNDLAGLLTNFFDDESSELSTVIQSITQTVVDNSELSALLDDFFVDEVVELSDDFATFIQAETEISEVQSELLVGINCVFFDEEDHDELATFVQAEIEIAEISGDLSNLLDNFSVEQEIQPLPDLDDLFSEPGFELVQLLEPQLSLSSLVAQSLLDEEATIRTNDPEPAIIPEQQSILLHRGYANDPLTPVKRSIQISVPLDRLDKSAQQVVDTLLTARAVMSVSSQLQSQLTQLTTLTRENSQFVTRLRQLQDDYALLRNLSDEQQDSTSNVTLERYRQGYTTINRLLENILRLSELGQEIETSTYHSAIRLDTLDRSILQLKDGIETSRLVPFRNLTLRSKAILRDLTNRYQKPAELTIENEQIELDAGIVQQLEPALLHLLRNAYDHGLESVQQRLAAGKVAQGKIQISLQQRGNLYFVSITDDGGGIDAQRIHEIATSKGFALNQTRTNAELLAVLCQPGFSSNSTITEVSGRGVGMDVVVAQIASIGGKLSLTTTPGQGTTFTIEVPAPQLLIPCVMFQVGDRIIAIPTDNILETALLSSMTATDIDLTAPGMCTRILTNQRGEIPGFDLHDYWQPSNSANHSSQGTLPDTAVCIRTKQADDTPEIWTIADDLLGQAKLLINPLPSPLISPLGLLGVSLQPDGKLISILDPIALTALITSTASASTPTLAELATDTNPEPARSSAPTILIVDDAAMIRRRLEVSLNTYGFITHTCNDGLEALTWLQTHPAPDLMITDVEMPNMDGFTLIDRIRQANINIPILVVSSRSSAEWGKEARRLGATDYLNKGFATSELLQKVNSLLGLLVDV